MTTPAPITPPHLPAWPCAASSARRRRTIRPSPSPSSCPSPPAAPPTSWRVRSASRSPTDTKQAVVVDNKAGASGMIAAQAAARAPPDGYTVLITTNTTHAANEHLYKKLPYDPVKDFAPVTGLGKGGQVLVVNADSPYKSVADLLADGEAEAGQAHLRQRQLVQPRRRRAVPADERHRHPARALQEQPAGDHRPARRPDRHDDHRHRPPACRRSRAASCARWACPPSKRSPLLPDVPTIDEAGVKGYDMGYWFAAYVPAKHAARGGRSS